MAGKISAMCILNRLLWADCELHITCRFYGEMCTVSRFRRACWMWPACCVFWNFLSLVCTGWSVSSFFTKFQSKLGIERISLLRTHDLRTSICFSPRKSLRHHIRAPQVPHQPARELRHLQAHAGRWALGPLPVLQRLLREHLLEGKPRLHQDRRGRAAGLVHRWIQWHFPSHRGQRGLFDPRRKTQRLQLRQQPCAAGRPPARGWLGASGVFSIQDAGSGVMGAAVPLLPWGLEGVESAPARRTVYFILLPCVLWVGEGKQFAPVAQSMFVLRFSGTCRCILGYVNCTDSFKSRTILTSVCVLEMETFCFCLLEERIWTNLVSFLTSSLIGQNKKYFITKMEQSK